MKLLPFLFPLLCSCTFSVSPIDTRPVSHDLDSPELALTVEEMEQFIEHLGGWCPSDVGNVRVVNPAPVLVKDAKAKALKGITGKQQAFVYDDNCLSESKGWWQAIGLTQENPHPRVLIRYWGPLQRDRHTSCPPGTLFFLWFDEFRRRCEVTTAESPSAEQAAEQEQEKETVRELLKQNGK